MTLRDRMLNLAKVFQEKADKVDATLPALDRTSRAAVKSAMRLFVTRLLLEIKEHDEQ